MEAATSGDCGKMKNVKAVLGDTVRFQRAPKLCDDMNEQLRKFFEEKAWHDDPINVPTPQHIRDQWIDVVLTTQEMVDEYNETGTLRSIK